MAEIRRSYGLHCAHPAQSIGDARVGVAENKLDKIALELQHFNLRRSDVRHHLGSWIRAA